MKEPATRVVWVTRYAAQTPRRSSSKHRRLHRLFALMAIVAGSLWLFQQVHGSGGSSLAHVLRRVLGVEATARLEAAYRDVLDKAGLGPAANPTPMGTVIAVSGPAMPTAPPVASATPIVQVASSSAMRRGVLASGVTAPAGTRIAPPTPTPLLLAPSPASAVLQNDYQVFETWNNCGPASLSMALSYFGIQESQAALGQDLRPYQNSDGNNDDKDVTLDALAGEARKFGLLAYHRPGGNIHLLKNFIANGMPVVAETVLTKDDDIGHYRVVKGYDDASSTIVQDDSMQGHNVRFSYADFDYMWKKYNYEYLVLVPRAKQRLAEAMLGKNLNNKTAWQQAVRMDQATLARNPSDIDSRFNLSVALYYIGDYQGSVNEYEKVQYQLPFRTLWYQIEPIEAYYELGDYQRVFSITDSILNNGNRAFSQLYIIRGRIYQKQGNIRAAKAEFEKAVFYNTNLKEARDALKSVS